MNDLYTFVEQAFRNYSELSVMKLAGELANNPGKKSQIFGLPINLQYVIKRLLGAILAKEPNIKFNAYLALTAVSRQLKNVKTETLYEHIASISNYKKHCQGKATQVDAYVIGKILAIKALKSVFASNLNVINHLTDLLLKFTEYEEQIIQLISELSTDKKSIIAFNKLAPTTKAGFVLHTILKSKFKKIQPELNQNVVRDVLAELVSVYPKHSICIDYLAPQIKISFSNPSKFFQEQLSAIFESNSEINIRLLYYILQLLEGHLKGTKLNAQNLGSMVSVKVLGGWILQLKVKNKYIRKIAESIKIEFESDPAFAFNLLSQLHEKQLYLENINHKHPLFQLYLIVDPHQYAQYLLNLVSKESTQQDEDKQFKGHYNELEVFLVTRHKELTVQQISQIILVFVNKYHQSKEQSALQAINTIFNALLSFNPKKTQVLHTRASLILSKLKFQLLEIGEHQNQVKQIAKKIRNLFKANKQENEVFNISFYNFLLSVGFYFLIYPEEIDIFSDLEIVDKDIRTNILFSESGIQSKKKRKLSGDNDKNKPIHVLIDIFISLLTKSSQFLRATINHLFEKVIPYIDSSDISHLLEVISKPDAQYIEDAQVNE